MNKLLLYQIAIIIVIYLGYGFYNLTRRSISFMLPHFSTNTSNSINITKNDIGIIISSQYIAYGLSKFFCGILSDLFSCRILFGAGLFMSGLLNIGFKKEIKIYNIYFLSFLIGLAQGPAWPTCGKIIQKWFPKTQFATWWSIVSTSSNVAGAIGPLVATSIALRYHWSYGFMIPGCICMSVGYLAIIVLRNKPSDVGLVDFDSNEQTKDNNEQDLDSDNYDEQSNDDTENKVELTRFEKTKMMIKYPFFLSICLGYFIAQLLKTLYSDWSQIYLTKAIKVDHYTASYFLSMFEISGIFGTLLSGILSDLMFYLKTRNSPKPIQDKDKQIKIRMTLICFFFIGLIICMHLFNFYVVKNINSEFLLSVAFLLGFLSYGSISLFGVMAMEFTTNEFSGTSHAIASLFANFGSIFAGLPFSIISKYYSWNTAFIFVEYLSIFVLIFILIFRNSKANFQPTNKVFIRKTQ